MIDPEHLLLRVIRRALMVIGMHSQDAELLVLGTACQESACGLWLYQLGGGPALGIFQMELATHNDIFENYLRFRRELKAKIGLLTIRFHADELIGNLNYAAAMCRLKYARDPEPIPDNLPAQAAYWKRVYNTEQGAGTVDEYIRAWHQFVGNRTFPLN